MRAFFLRMFCNRMADGLLYVVTAWLLLKLTGRSSSIAYQLMLTLLPSVLLSPFVGVWTDRISRRAIVIAADCFQGTLILATAALLYFSFTGIWYVYAMTLAVGISVMFHQISARALLREIVDKEGLMLASSTVSIANQSGGLLGPVVGGIIAFRFGELSALVIAGLVSLVGAASIKTIRRAEVATVHGRAGGQSIWQDYRAGLQALKENPHTARMFIACLLFYVSLPLLNFMLPLLLIQKFHTSVQTFGLIDAMFGIGGVSAGLALHSIEERLGQQQMMVVGVFLFGVMIMLFPLLDHHAWLLACYFGVGFFCHSGVTLMSELQGSISTTVQGRVISLFNVLVSLGAAAAIQFIDWLVPSDNIIAAYWAYGFLQLLFVGLFLARWIRGAKEVPATS